MTAWPLVALALWPAASLALGLSLGRVLQSCGRGERS